MIGMSDKKVQKFVYFLISIWEMKIVNKGVEFLIVFVKDIVIYFRVIRLSIIVENL